MLLETVSSPRARKADGSRRYTTTLYIVVKMSIKDQDNHNLVQVRQKRFYQRFVKHSIVCNHKAFSSGIRMRMRI
jgi:poly(A) polymerase Pap1